jgi:hypothetical protein
MRKVLLPLAFLSTSTLLACSFQMHAGTEPQHPQKAPPPPPATSTAPNVQPGAVRHIGKRTTGPSGPTPAPTTTTTTPVPVPTTTAGTTVVTPTIFGNSTVDATGYKGALYWIPAGTQKLPTLTSMTPNGYLFSHDLNVAPQAFTTGFPGIDASHTSNFAIHYEAPLVVSTEADYDFRLVSDDGAVLKIDGTPIIDNDGIKTTATSKEGPVHLVVGTHVISVDYFQATGNVGLQLFCKKFGDTEKVCPTSL